MARWLPLVHIITYKLLDQAFECCWRSFLRVLGIFLYRSNPFALFRECTLFTAVQIPIAMCWELMHLQDKRMPYLLSRELEQVQRT